MRVGVLTVSDRAHQGIYQDEAGPLLGRLLNEGPGWEIAHTAVVPDEIDVIRDTLIEWCDREGLDLILTAGGTGFAPRDITPEATRAVIEREAPGLAEAMRAASLRATPHAVLSRAVCGMRGRTLIVNLPGSPRAARENLEVILPALPHALALLTGAPDAEAGHRKI